MYLHSKKRQYVHLRNSYIDINVDQYQHRQHLHLHIQTPFVLIEDLTFANGTQEDRVGGKLKQFKPVFMTFTPILPTTTTKKLTMEEPKETFPQLYISKAHSRFFFSRSLSIFFFAYHLLLRVY